MISIFKGVGGQRAFYAVYINQMEGHEEIEVFFLMLLEFLKEQLRNLAVIERSTRLLLPPATGRLSLRFGCAWKAWFYLTDTRHSFIDNPSSAPASARAAHQQSTNHTENDMRRTRTYQVGFLCSCIHICSSYRETLQQGICQQGQVMGFLQESSQGIAYKWVGSAFLEKNKNMYFSYCKAFNGCLQTMVSLIDKCSYYEI